MEVLKIRDINGNWIEIPYLKGDTPGLSEYQKKLTAGTNITIDENNVISATGGGVTEEQVNTLIDSKTTSYNFKVGEEPTTKGLDILNNLWNTDVAYNYTYGDLSIFLEGIPVQLIKDGNVFRLSGTYNQFTQADPHSEIYCGTITPTLTNGTITSYTVELGGLPINGMRVMLTANSVSKLIDDKAISYNFKVNESNTDVGLRIVKDLWAGNFTKYNLTFNGEPVYRVYKDEINYNNKLIFTILRADYQHPSGPLLIGRLINLTFENNEIVGYTVSGSNAGGQYVVGHTDAQINTLIDNKNLQPKLTAGENITIQGNVISATGGSSSLPETPTNNGNYSLVATVKDGGIEFAWKSISGVWQLPTKINNDLKLFQAATINKINNTLEVY